MLKILLVLNVYLEYILDIVKPLIGRSNIVSYLKESHDGEN